MTANEHAQRHGVANSTLLFSSEISQFLVWRAAAARTTAEAPGAASELYQSHTMQYILLACRLLGGN